jgi:Fe-S-cluster containining protein
MELPQMEQSWITGLELEEDTLTVTFNIPHEYGTHEYRESFTWSRDYPPSFLKDAASEFMKILTTAVNERVASKQKVPCETCTSHCCRYYDTIRILPMDVNRFIQAGISPRDTMVLWDDLPWPEILNQEAINSFPKSMDGTIGYMKKVPWYRDKKQSACSLVDDKGCTVYENRPQICREYPAFGCDIHDPDDKKIKGLVKLRSSRNGHAVL